MFDMKSAFGSYSVNDLAAAKKFYGDTLGLTVTDLDMGALSVELAGQQRMFLYEKPNHQPATFTVLNFEVDDVEKAVDELNAMGIKTKIYADDEIEGLPNDEKGIVRGDDSMPGIAWFKDPAENVIAVMQVPAVMKAAP